jgi:hypothetical protein
MKLSNCRAIAFALTLLLAPAAAQADGILEVRIKDHREAIGDFSKLILNLDTIAISPKAGLKFWQSGWKNLELANKTIDLTQYSGNKSAQIFRGTAPDGSFEGIELKVKEVIGTLKKGAKPAKVKNSAGAIKLPFQIASNRTTLIVLDFVVLDMSDHPPQGYDLGIRGWELFVDGKLVDRIPPG